MLARSADNLFWVARYIERADFSARMIDAALRLAALPKAYGGDENEWTSPLGAVGNLTLFQQLYEKQDQDSVFAFLAFDRQNPSSIRNCIANARRAARAVRTALTLEMWESINSAWLELRRIESERDAQHPMSREEVDRFLDFVKAISRDFDGAAYRTMLRDDAYWFNRIGLYVERADNTARILDVKYHVLLPQSEEVGGTLDRDGTLGGSYTITVPEGLVCGTFSLSLWESEGVLGDGSELDARWLRPEGSVVSSCGFMLAGEGAYVRR